MLNDVAQYIRRQPSEISLQLEMFGILITIILLATMDASPIQDTTENQGNILEISTTSKQVLEDTVTDSLFENKTVSKLNFTTVSIMLTNASSTLNSTARSGSIQEKALSYNRTTYYYYSNYGTSSNKSHSRLSRGVIAGINIGVIALLCCFGIVGACLKRRH